MSEQVVNAEIPQEVKQPETNVFNETTQEAPEVTSSEENVFENVQEQNPDEKVPLKVLQEKVAKVKHSKDKVIRQLQTELSQRDMALASLQQPNQVNPQAPLQQMPSVDQIMQHIEVQATKKANEDKIREVVTPAYEKYDDFQEITQDLPWSEGLILAAKRELPKDAGEFIYHLSKSAPKAVREIASATTGEERGALITKYTDMWKRRAASGSVTTDKKIISRVDAPPQKIKAGIPGMNANDPKSYQAALARTGKFRSK